jgi:hypothetical protein
VPEGAHKLLPRRLFRIEVFQSLEFQELESDFGASLNMEPPKRGRLASAPCAGLLVPGVSLTASLTAFACRASFALPEFNSNPKDS